MDQDQLRIEMGKAARLIIHAKQSENITLFPNSRFTLPGYRMAVRMEKHRDACVSAAIMFLLIFITGAGGPLETIWGFLPAMLCLTFIFILYGIVINQKATSAENAYAFAKEEIAN